MSSGKWRPFFLGLNLLRKNKTVCIRRTNIGWSMQFLFQVDTVFHALINGDEDKRECGEASINKTKEN